MRPYRRPFRLTIAGEYIKGFAYSYRGNAVAVARQLARINHEPVTILHILAPGEEPVERIIVQPSGSLMKV